MNKVTKPFGLLATVCVVCMVGLLGWEGVPTGAQPAAKEPYLVGHISSYEGQSSALTGAIPKVVDFWSDRMNKLGGINGHPVKVIRRENESRPELNAVAVRSLAQEGVSAIIGPISTSDSKVAEPLAEEFHISMLSSSGGYRPPKTSKYSYSIICSTPLIQEAQIKYFKKQGAKSYGILADTTGTGDSAIDQIKPLCKQYGLDVVIERFNITDVDVTPQLIKLLAAKVDFIYLGTFGGQILTTLGNYRALGREVPLILSGGVQDANWLKQIVGKESKNLYIGGGARLFSPESLDPKDPLKKTLTWLVNNFPGWQETVAGSQTAAWLESMMLICSALAEVGPDREAINNWIDTKVREMYGFTNVYNSRDPDYHKLPIAAGFLGKPINGKWINMVETMTIIAQDAKPLPFLSQFTGVPW